MPTQQGTADYIVEQLQELGSVRVRKMFGEYALYCNEKVVGLICDDQLFIKYTEKGKSMQKVNTLKGMHIPEQNRP